MRVIRQVGVGIAISLAGATLAAAPGWANTGTPVVTTQPASQTVSPGSTASFSSFADGSPTPTVSWQASTDGGQNWSDVGVTSNTLNVSNVSAAQNGNEYRAVFTNNAGTATSNAAILGVAQGAGNIAITTEPQSQAVPAGGTATFTASANGSPAPTVGWDVSTDNGSTWTSTGVTSTTLTITNVAAGQNGNQYRAVFSNSSGVLTSSAARLTVTGPPSGPAVTLPPAVIGQPYSVTLTANGGKAPYTWTLAAGSGPLPAGLSLAPSGVISGTPTGNPGTVSFTVQVADSSSPVEVATETATVVLKPLTTNTCAQGNLAFVCQVYVDLLSRNATSGEQALWLNSLNAGALSREGVGAAIATSGEYRLNLVRGLFGTYLHRVPDVGGLLTNAGLLNAGASDETVLAGILGSAEYFARAGSTNDGFLKALYIDLLSRSPEAAGVAAWNQQIAGGLSRAAIAASIMASPEYRGDLVAGDYIRLLGRPVDPGGVGAWVSAMGGGRTDEQIVAGLIGSQEYFNRAQRRS